MSSRIIHITRVLKTMQAWIFSQVLLTYYHINGNETSKRGQKPRFFQLLSKFSQFRILFYGLLRAYFYTLIIRA